MGAFESRKGILWIIITLGHQVHEGDTGQSRGHGHAV